MVDKFMYGRGSKISEGALIKHCVYGIFIVPCASNCPKYLRSSPELECTHFSYAFSALSIYVLGGGS